MANTPPKPAAKPAAKKPSARKRATNPAKPRQARTAREAAERLEQQHRDDMAWNMRLASVPTERIASTLGVAVGSVPAMVRRATSRHSWEITEEGRQIAAAQLALLLEPLIRDTLQPNPVIGRDGQPVTIERRQADGSTARVPMLDLRQRAQSATAALRVAESYRALLGWDAAERYEVTGDVTVSASREEALQAVLARVHEIRPAPMPELTEGEETG